MLPTNGLASVITPGDAFSRIGGSALRIVLVIASLLVPPPCAAGPTLWRNIEAGMSVTQVQKLYPADKGSVHHKPKVTIIENVQQVGRCHPDVLVEHPAGTVEKVIVRGRYRGFPKEACSDEAAKAMLSKYGTPQDEDESSQETGGVITSGLFKGLDTTRTERQTKQVWVRDGVLITFERDDPDLDGLWRITYEVRQDIGL